MQNYFTYDFSVTLFLLLNLLSFKLVLLLHLIIFVVLTFFHIRHDIFVLPVKVQKLVHIYHFTLIFLRNVFIGSPRNDAEDWWPVVTPAMRNHKSLWNTADNEFFSHNFATDTKRSSSLHQTHTHTQERMLAYKHVLFTLTQKVLYLILLVRLMRTWGTDDT